MQKISDKNLPLQFLEKTDVLPSEFEFQIHYNQHENVTLT